MQLSVTAFDYSVLSFLWMALIAFIPHVFFCLFLSQTLSKAEGSQNLGFPPAVTLHRCCKGADTTVAVVTKVEMCPSPDDLKRHQLL